MQETHRVVIGNLERNLPICEVAPGVRVALFNSLGDWEMIEAAGRLLMQRMPPGIEALIMPDGKAQALLHVVARETRLPSFVARKEHKSYMEKVVVSITRNSITTSREQRLYLSGEDMMRLRNKRVMMVDDVVSTGGTLETIQDLLILCGATFAGAMAVFTEGRERDDVIALGHLPLF